MTTNVTTNQIDQVINKIIDICIYRPNEGETGVGDDIRITYEREDDSDVINISIYPESRGNGAHEAAYQWVSNYVASIGSDKEVYRNVDAYDVCISIV